MKKIFICLLSLFLMSAASIEANAQHIFKGIFLRSKEKLFWTQTIFPEMDDNVIRSFDSSEVKDTTMYGYYECVLTLDLDCATEAYSYFNNPDVQEDLVKYLASPNFFSDSLVVVMANYIKSEKTLDKVCEKLKNLEDYDSYFFNNPEDLTKEMSKYSDRRLSTKYSFVSLWAKDGLIYCGRDFTHIIAIYDTETGKRIEPSNLFKSQPVIISDDTLTVTRIVGISNSKIDFNYENGRSCKNVDNGSHYLTPYAKKLMEKSKNYYVRTNENQYGDLIRTYYFDNENDGTSKVLIPYKLHGCKNTDKVRNRMLDVMFGKHDGNVDSLIFNSSMMKNYPENEYNRLLEIGEGLVSFGYENERARNNRDNHFIVFDKTSGNEITVNDLIKDKEGFIKFINSFNMYIAGFLFDSSQINSRKMDPKFDGEQFKKYVRNNLRHAMSRISEFDGFDTFPTMWWFPFNQYDNVLVPVEFDTETMRIFLDYNDIRKFINPKYLSVMDAAADCALKKKRNDD